jgi:DNA polymerase-3 subunit delta
MSISDCYLLWGEEEYIIDQEIDSIIEQLKTESGEEPERISLDADELSTSELMQSLDFSPLFASRRVVVVKKPFWLAKSNRKTRKMEEAWQVIKDYLNQTWAGQTLILTFPEHNSSNPLVKLLDKKAQVIPCKKPDSKSLAAWITKEFRQYQREANPSAINLLVKSGQNMYYLKNTIAKVCLMVDNRTINEVDVANQLDLRNEINIFKLTDALLSRNLPLSLKAYKQLLSQGQPPVLLLNMMVRQFATMAKIKGYLERGLSKEQIEEITGQKEFFVRKMIEKSRNFSRIELRQLFTAFLETDNGFKTSGKDQRILIELLIIDICTQK